jgi:hypothetical protein
MPSFSRRLRLCAAEKRKRPRGKGTALLAQLLLEGSPSSNVAIDSATLINDDGIVLGRKEIFTMNPTVGVPISGSSDNRAGDQNAKLTISYPREQARNLSNAKVFTSLPKIPDE